MFGGRGSEEDSAAIDASISASLGPVDDWIGTSDMAVSFDSGIVLLSACVFVAVAAVVESGCVSACCDSGCTLSLGKDAEVLSSAMVNVPSLLSLILRSATDLCLSGSEVTNL